MVSLHAFVVSGRCEFRPRQVVVENNSCHIYFIFSFSCSRCLKQLVFSLLGEEFAVQSKKEKSQKRPKVKSQVKVFSLQNYSILT